MSFSQTVQTSKTPATPAPFPNTKGTATLKVLNGDQSLGPAVALLRMEPGSENADECKRCKEPQHFVLRRKHDDPDG